ncbi:translocation/assembly module TamB [Pedobacter sp. HMF7647]|uniref:Translocation/assembly module TamB n=1 Tax=Hufsiella arboris TaxID=2695275 RepID=A0A7K1YEV3_9SPHI|nr:translocation/assembly module TamB [Hufsiella arboris]
MFVLIRVPAVQNFARQKAVSYLEGKIGTKVEINRISLDLPKLIVLEDIYFEDQKKDTLLAGDTIRVDVSLLKLLHNKLEINELDFRGITANIQRTPDSVFNFDYITKAFVSEQKKEPKPEDTTSTMKFSLDKINLDRIRARFKDAITANDVDVYLGHFDTRVKEFDLDKMKFNVPKIKLSNVYAKVIQGKPAATPEPKAVDSIKAAEPMNMDLALKTIDLDRIKVDYRNDVSAMKTNVSLGRLLVETDKIDLKKQLINLNTIALQNSDILFQLGKTQQAKIVANEASKEVEVQANNWKVTLANADFSNNNIRFDNFNMPVQKQGLDFGHLNIKNFGLKAENFVYAINTISGNIKDGHFSDRSGFDLRKIQTDFFYGSKQAYLNNLYIATSRSVLRDRIRLNYPSIESLSKNPGEMRVDANLAGSKLGFKDVILLVPSLAGTNPFKSNPNAVLTINGKVNGQVKNLNIPSLEISGFRSTHILASAKITGLPDVNKAFFDLNIKDFSTRSSDLASFVPPGTLPPSIRLPEALKLNGTFKGGITNFATNLNLNSSFGSAKAIASYNAVRKGSERYKANVRLFNFNVGRLIKQEKTIGRITLAANVDGVGTDPKTMRANLNGKVFKADYNNYTYRNLSLKGSSQAGVIIAKANMLDPNITFDMAAKANMNKKYPQIKADLMVDSVNLQKLNFSKEDIRFHGKLAADLPTADPDYLNGKILLTQALLAKSGQRFQMDTVSIVSTATADSNTLALKSELLSANVRGKYKLTQIGTALQDLISKYYSTSTVKQTVKYSPQYFTFNAKLVNAPILANFAPDLKELATVTMNGNFDSRSQQLNFNASAPRVLYGTNDVNNLQMRINTDNNALNYSVTVDKLAASQIQILNTSISGNAKDNVITTAIEIRDSKKKDHYRIAGSLKALSDLYEFSLNPDGLLLNYQPWTVAQNNLIRFGAGGVEARDFKLSNNNQSISINTIPAGLNNPMKIDFSNFQIETITQMVKKDSLLIGGTINGTTTVSNFQASPVFVADMNVDHFNFKGDTLGNIAIKVNNQQANTYAANVSITGNGNQVDLTGNYYTGTSSMDMNLNIANLNLKSIQGFTMGNLKDATGAITGQLSIKGTASSPQVLGDVNFKQVGFRIAMLNSYFRINNDRISFNDQGINFDKFTLLDSAGNKASVDGMVYTKNFTDYRFDLDVRADDFQALNSTAKDNELFYGKLFFNTRLKIKGDMNQPNIDGSLKINDKTNFTVVLPQSDPGIEERQGIVEFVDMDNLELASALTSQKDTTKSALSGLDFSANIEIDKGAVFNVIVDQGTGDFLQVRGTGQLNAGMDPSGKISLTGTYELEEGAYNLSFNFIKRKFDIKKGSTLTWTGEPTSANVNVTAVYVANTAPIDLMENQLSGTASENNRYKQKLPFDVNLTMEGELMKPQFTFAIDLPEKSYNVSSDVISSVRTRLDQLETEPSELNKQVFALLLLNRFVGENPFASSAGGTTPESMARQSVSKLLSDQLNNLAGGLIEGVDLNVGLESSDDYTTGERKDRTDLNVGVSKRLLSDRLKVSVGSNFELEGPKQANQSTSNIAGNIEVEYQLSKDGRYLIRGYQKNEYESVIQGQVIETGLGFTLNADYNKFKELFAKKSKEDKARKRAEKEKKKQERQERKND